jgi:hypothetical protein
MAKQKYPKIIILNMGGTHGQFLRYTLDKFCTATPAIHEIPFNALGNSHAEIKYSGQFQFEEGVYDDQMDFENKNIIYMDIGQEALYYERANINRSGDADTDLYSETAIAQFLKTNGNDFPDYCKSKNITLKDGYMYGFKNMATQGSIIRNKKRIATLVSKNYNIFLYKIKNFFTVKDFKKSIIEIGKHFNIEFDLTGIDELYQEFYERNQILKTHYKVKDYLNGNKSIALDILQQAYVDAQTN